MKKILSAILILGAVLSLASCKMSGEERLEKYQEKESEKIAASVEAEEKYYEGIKENAEEIGKSQKGKRLILEIPYVHGVRYDEFIIAKDGLCKEKISYFFYNDAETYEMNLSIDDPNVKILKKDKDARMIAYKKDIDPEAQKTYDELYASYTMDYYKERNYKIVE